MIFVLEKFLLVKGFRIRYAKATVFCRAYFVQPALFPVLMFPFAQTIFLRSVGGKALRTLLPAGAVVVALLLLAQGCVTLPTASNGSSDEDDDVHSSSPASGQSLEDAINGMIPLPPGVTSRGSAAVEDPAEKSPAPSRGKHAANGEPILQMGYVIRVQVVVGDKPEVPAQNVQILDRNEIDLPLVGKVDCTGLTMNGLRSRLTSRYSEYFRNPVVSVSYVASPGISPWGSVYVMGAVRSEGWIDIPPTRDLRVSRAIQAAGGVQSVGKKNDIRVTRKNPDGTREVFQVDLVAMAKRGDDSVDIVLLPDDKIFVYEQTF